MSITFWAPEAPEDFEEYDCCNDPNCPFCEGKGVARFPFKEGEFNVSNTNGMRIQRWFGFPEPDYAGSIPVEKLQILGRHLLSLDADPERKAFGASLYFESYGADRVQRYLDSMIRLVDTAIAHNSPLCWG